MAGPTEAHGPTYISSRSADVILSDIRPIKLNLEALRSINVLLDEFLYSVLNAARSLTTNQLRAGLLKVLPTTLGKEALLEAEMELRAYLERTGSSGASLVAEEQGKGYHLQWSYELLRLKCQAYSTLSDSDEDEQAEMRLAERMSHAAASISPPKPTLVAPAALYLTAILESICEHVLSNVGRVAARDSSRTTASVHDLFVALCEDDSIYSLFKTMKVYEKIEGLSKMSKPRRSKSLSRTSSSRTSLGQTPILSQSSSLPFKTHTSSESTVSVATTLLASTHRPSHSRSSFDKTRAMKMFINNRSSAEQGGNNSLDGSQRLHMKSDSNLSDSTKSAATIIQGDDQLSRPDSPTLDDQEFDDIMRSGSTMKVSLTPDRLKSMEVHNKEKGHRGGRRAIQSRQSVKSMSISAASEQFGATSGQVSEPIEDYSSNMAQVRERQVSVPSPINSMPPVTAAITRLRSVSTSIPPAEKLSHTARQLSKSSLLSSFSSTPQSPEQSMPAPKVNSATGFPPRTRRVARNRASLDLDDVMGRSSDEDLVEVVAKKPTLQPRYAVSASARDLIEFLAEGPPDTLDVSMGVGGNSMLSLDVPKAKGGRLQRMISKLTLKDSEQRGPRTNNGGGESYSKSSSKRSPSTMGHSQLSLASPTGLMNKPVPPRPPPSIPVSPPSSPSQYSFSETSPPSPIPRRPSITRKATSSTREHEPTTSGLSVGNHAAVKELPPPSSRALHPTPKLPAAHGHTHVHTHDTDEDKLRVNAARVRQQSQPNVNNNDVNSFNPGVLLVPPERHPARKAKSAAAKHLDTEKPSPSTAFTDHAREMHRLLTHATNADECRIIVDMFLVKSGMYLESVNPGSSYPSPPPEAPVDLPSTAETELESSLVELFLGGAGDVEADVEADEDVDADVNDSEPEAEEDEEPLSPTDTVVSKEAPLILPHDTPYTTHDNVVTAQKVVMDAPEVI